MRWLILFINILSAIAYIVPPSPLSLTGLGPKCFPTRPHCIRPRVDECRDAIHFIGISDPGYPLILGRPEIVDHDHHTYHVPKIWSSVPINCIVQVDVTDPKATQEVRLKTLAAMAEVVVRRCVIGGSGCGGEVSVGEEGRLKLVVAYYTAMDRLRGGLPWRVNGTGLVGDV